MMKRLILLMCLVPAIATADPAVLAVDGSNVYIDLGAKDGVGAGTEVELLHEIVAKDPRTGATLRDRFALGTLVVVKSGDRLSVARADATLAKRVLAGDTVRLVSEKRTFVDPWVAQVEASKLGPGADPNAPATAPGGPAIDHVGLAGKAWQETLSRSPEERIARWQKFLADDPRTPYRKLVENEIKSLEVQLRARDEALARARSSDGRDRDPRIAHLAEELAKTSPVERGAVLAVASLSRAVPGRPIQLAFLVRTPRAIQQAWLYVKPEGDPGYRRIDLAADGDAYLRGTIEGGAVKAGTLSWYVEAIGRGADAEVEPVLGSQVSPNQIEIDANVEEKPIAQGRSHIDAHVDYVDFDGGFADGHDQYYQAEIDFTYRFLEPVYAVRLGFGTLSGMGGPKDIIDADPMRRCIDGNGNYRCKRVDFTYVYTELEFRLRPNIALMIRPQAGLLAQDDTMDPAAGRCRNTSDPTGCRFETGFGARARVRFGEEVGTNLVVGASFTDGVGTLLEAAYHWLPHVVVPVQLTVQVTDQPLPEDFGVRLIGDVGFRHWSWFYPSVRLSYQARDIDHGGVSGGLALNFDW